MLEDDEIAGRLLERCRHRLSGSEIALLEAVIEGENLNDGEWWCYEDERSFLGLQTEFAAALA